jgi:hypothetical protein
MDGVDGGPLDLRQAEPVGWQVSFEGSMPQQATERFVVAVATHLEREAQQPVEWLRIAW